MRPLPLVLSDSLTCRQVLNIMVILGFMLNYMLRVNMTIAIVSMVIPSNDTWRLNDSSKSATTEYFDRGIAVNVTLLDNGTATIAPNPATASFPYAPAHVRYSLSFEGFIVLLSSVRYDQDFRSASQEETNRTRYPWNEYQVNLVLGSFFWGYICTELPGGRLAEVVGPKRVFGYSMMVSSAITLLTPLSATYGYIAVVALRAVLGFMLVSFSILTAWSYRSRDREIDFPIPSCNGVFLCWPTPCNRFPTYICRELLGLPCSRWPQGGYHQRNAVNSSRIWWVSKWLVSTGA